MNMPIAQGVRLETGPGARAEVEFENGTVLRLAGKTSVEFDNLTLHDDGERASEMRVNSGVVYVNYKRKDGGDFRLDAGNTAIDVDRDVHFRLRLTGPTAEVAVFKGELDLPGNGETAKIKKDETFKIDLNDSSQDLMAKGITSLHSDEWDSQRNDYNTQYASTFSQSQYPYAYGLSDLGYYGGFFNAPGYGLLWQPYGVNAGWDPFADGAWAYYGGPGYMWVSSYPWGWTPYRYGSWLYVPTYGWAWQPGGWNSFNTYPVVVNAPTTWRRPIPPGRGVRAMVMVGHPTFVRAPMSMNAMAAREAAQRYGYAGTRTPAASPRMRTGPDMRATPPAMQPMPGPAGMPRSAGAGRPPRG